MARKRIKHEVTIVVNNSYSNNEVPIVELYDYSDPITKIYVTGKVEFLTDSGGIFKYPEFENVISNIIKEYVDIVRRSTSDSDKYGIIKKLKRNIPSYEKLLEK